MGGSKVGVVDYLIHQRRQSQWMDAKQGEMVKVRGQENDLYSRILNGWARLYLSRPEKRMVL